MKKEEIRVGGRYVMRVSGNLVVVVVDSINVHDGTSYIGSSGRTIRTKAKTTYEVTNTATNRVITVKSASRFRREAAK